MEDAITLIKAGANDFICKDDLLRLTVVLERTLQEADNLRLSNQAEDQIKLGEEQYKGLFENSEVCIWVHDFSEVLAVFSGLRDDGIKNIRNYLESDDRRAARECAIKVRVVDFIRATLRLFNAKSKNELIGQIAKTFGLGSLAVFIDELCAIWDGKKRFRAEVAYRTLEGREGVEPQVALGPAFTFRQYRRPSHANNAVSDGSLKPQSPTDFHSRERSIHWCHTD